MTKHAHMNLFRCHRFKVVLIVGAAQEIAVSQHSVQSAGPQVILKHVGSTVDVGKTCRREISVTNSLSKNNNKNLVFLYIVALTSVLESCCHFA